MMCFACHCRPIAPSRRKFCDQCGPRSSTLWKRSYRRLLKKLGQKYWQDGWRSDHERRAYYRAYMRRYRGRKQVEGVDL